MRHSLTEPQIQEACARYIDGEGTTTLAQSYGVSDTAILYHLEKRQIQRRDQSHACQQYQVDENFFDNINNEAKAYVLGFIQADGYVAKDSHCLELTLASKDVDHLSKICQCLKSSHPVKYRLFSVRGKLYESVRVTIGNQRICRTLQKLMTEDGLCTLPTTLVHHFVRGYFDGDGYVWIGTKRGASAGFAGSSISSRTNEKFLTHLRQILSDFSGLNFVQIQHQKPGHGINLRYGGNGNVRKLYRFMYRDAHIFLERKRHIFALTYD